jgi:hypothetical protein
VQQRHPDKVIALALARRARQDAAMATKKSAAKKSATRKATGGTSKQGTEPSASASALIDGRIAELGDWRGETLARVRALIKRAVPEVSEEWKWRGVPVWSDHGILCTGETYKDYVKLTFAKGAALDDPSGLFNASLEGNTRRAIDLRQGVALDERALTALIRSAATLNRAARK